MQREYSFAVPKFARGCALLWLAVLGAFVLLLSLLRGGCSYTVREIEDSSVTITTEAPLHSITYHETPASFRFELKDPNRDLVQLSPVIESARLTSEFGRSYPLQFEYISYNGAGGQPPASAQNVWLAFYFYVHDPDQPSKNFNSLPPGRYKLSLDFNGVPDVTHFSASFLIHDATKPAGKL